MLKQMGILRMRRVLLLVAVMSFALNGGAQLVSAQDAKKNETTPSVNAFSPDRPVTMIVPMAAGGSADLTARLVEKVWRKYCSQPLVVVNKPGGAGVVGALAVATSKPDGYTLGMAYGTGHDLVMPHLLKMEYDPFRDMVGISSLAINSTLIVVPENSPIKSIKDLIRLAKKENKPITAAVSTANGSVDLVMKGLGIAIGMPVTTVPHSGSSQAIITLLGGNTIISGGAPADMVAMLKSKKVRPIAVAAKQRDSVLPNVPTLIEQGVNFSSFGIIKGIAAPSKTPPAIISYYEKIFKKISEDPEFRKGMSDCYQPVNYMNSADFKKLFKSAYDDYGNLIRNLKLGPSK